MPFNPLDPQNYLYAAGILIVSFSIFKLGAIFTPRYKNHLQHKALQQYKSTRIKQCTSK